MISEHQMVSELPWNFQYTWLLSNTVYSFQNFQKVYMRYQEDDQLRQPQGREGGLEIEYHLSENETASPKSSREF